MPSSRRSGRERKAGKASVAPSVLVGLQSLVEGENEAVFSEMLSESAGDTLVDKWLSCMHVNGLSYEMLLVSYVDVGLLSEYCSTRLGKSGKGGASTLAARIAREWAKPAFRPLPVAPAGSSKRKPAEDAEPKKAEKKEKQEKKKQEKETAADAPPELVEAVKAALEAADQGDYPAELDSLWLCVLSVTNPRANLMPLLADGKLTETSAYKLYSSVLIDDSDYCNETSDDFLDLQRSFKTPAAAVPETVARAVRSGKVPSDSAPRFSRLWAAWLKGARWGSLAGEFVRAHEIQEIAEKSLPTKQGLLSLVPYNCVKPAAPGFLETLGLECENAEHERAFADAFVRVWARDGSVGRADVGGLVATACQRQRALARLGGS